MKKYICLRDDDTNYHTSPEDLVTGYGFVWGNFPITLAVVPFAHGSSQKMVDLDPSIGKGNSNITHISDITDDVRDAKHQQYENLRKWVLGAEATDLSVYHRVYPIGDNQELINFLMQQEKRGMVEIAQHGVSHRYTETGPEMLSDRMNLEAIRDGKEYLEKVFSAEIKTFIPPSNTIDSTCAKQVNKLGMHLLCSGGIHYYSRIERMIALLSHPKTCFDKLHYKLHKTRSPFTMENDIVVFGSITYDIFKKKENILAYLKKSLEETGFAALGTHYFLLAMNDDYRKNYLQVVAELSKMSEVEFVTAKDYYKLMMEARLDE